MMSPSVMTSPSGVASSEAPLNLSKPRASIESRYDDHRAQNSRSPSGAAGQHEGGSPRIQPPPAHQAKTLPKPLPPPDVASVIKHGFSAAAQYVGNPYLGLPTHPGLANMAAQAAAAAAQQASANSKSPTSPSVSKV